MYLSFVYHCKFYSASGF